MDRALIPAYLIDAAPATTLTRLARPNNSKVISPPLGRDVRLAYCYLKRYANDLRLSSLELPLLCISAEFE